MTLRAAQAWFAEAVMAPESDGERPGSDLADRWLTAGPRLVASERLEIYRRAYRARLVECLADDYPTLKAALGDEQFEALCCAYVARHPSTGPSLNAFGRHLPEFCAGSPDLTCAAFAADLAALEWAIVEVIHAPSTPPLSLVDLAGIPPEKWGGARLESTPALRLLRSAFPVNAYYQATRDGIRPQIPTAEPSATAVYRSGPTVWRMTLTSAMFELLTLLTSGTTLADALESTTSGPGDEADESEEATASRVMGWFRHWVSSGLFSRVVW
jgi:hypothetical protein